MQREEEIRAARRLRPGRQAGDAAIEIDRPHGDATRFERLLHHVRKRLVEEKFTAATGADGAKIGQAVPDVKRHLGRIHGKAGTKRQSD